MEQFTYFYSHSKLSVIIQKMCKNSPISSFVSIKQIKGLLVSVKDNIQTLISLYLHPWIVWASRGREPAF